MVCISGIVGVSQAEAATFSTPLTPVIAAGPQGDYLAADFDLGVTLAQIESVKIELVMTSGYEGDVMTTGNSTYSRVLQMVIHSRAEPLTTIWSPYAVQNGTIRVLPQLSSEFSFGYGIIILEGMPTQPAWPSFLFGASGRVAFVDEYHSAFHPLPSGALVSSSTSWLPPEGLAEARLTIVGTPVPEPAAWILSLLADLVLPQCRRR